MRKSITYLSASLLAVSRIADVAAQCPAIFSCPVGSPIVCDISGNDPLLWKEPPYTWSKVLETSDLYEGAVDFSIKIVPCQGSSVNISYLLLLDLDNDDLLETAISSANPPPPGKVFVNNAFNPDYTGGDLVVFDKRSVPDSLKFRFTMETSPIWDTIVAQISWGSGSQFVSPKLPEGRHRLKWRVEQNGIVKYCEHSFRIKDCLPPTPVCKDFLNIEIDTGGTAALHLADLLVSAQDNTTPAYQLEFSLRKAGDGTGFPLNGGSPVTGLIYDCQELDSQKVELWAKDRLGNVAFCKTALDVTDHEGVCDVYPMLCARTWWDSNSVVQQTTFKMIWVDSSQHFVTLPLPPLPDGCAQMGGLPPANSFSLLAEKNNKPLNGVSTFDMLMITRHILGVQPFDSPWKFIAADVNRSGSVSTFDVLELRKLILGIYDGFPANTSWRFFAANCNFPDDPFDGFCPPEYSFLTTSLPNYPPQLPFNAVKVGDVNGTADPDSLAQTTTDTRGEPVFFDLPDWALEAGKEYDIPLNMTEAGAWLGFQSGLQFDAKVIEIEKVSPGALPGFDAGSFARPKPGLLNISWFNATPHIIFPDENLLTLRLRASADVRLRDVVAPSPGLAPEAYTDAGEIHPLQLRFLEKTAASPVGGTSVFSPQPNPTAAGAAVPLRLAQPETVFVEVTDFSGKHLFKQEIALESGAQMLEIPASAFPQAGVYVWRISAGEVAQSGKIVRI